MKKPSIPAPPNVIRDGHNPRLIEHLGALQTNVEIITGRRGGKVDYLRTNATLEETIDKINELLERLQG